MSTRQNIQNSRDSLSPKELMAYCLIIVYLFATCKPVLPVIADVLAHSFWEANHIESVHHTHGANHLHIEIAKAENHEESGQNNTALKFSEPLALHLAAIITYNFSRNAAGEPYLPASSSRLYNTQLESNYPPPKSS